MNILVEQDNKEQYTLLLSLYPREKSGGSWKRKALLNKKGFLERKMYTAYNITILKESRQLMERMIIQIVALNSTSFLFSFCVRWFFCGIQHFKDTARGI